MTRRMSFAGLVSILMLGAGVGPTLAAELDRAPVAVTNTPSGTVLGALRFDTSDQAFTEGLVVTMARLAVPLEGLPAGEEIVVELSLPIEAWTVAGAESWDAPERAEKPADVFVIDPRKIVDGRAIAQFWVEEEVLDWIRSPRGNLGLMLVLEEELSTVRARLDEARLQIHTLQLGG